MAESKLDLFQIEEALVRVDGLHLLSLLCLLDTGCRVAGFQSCFLVSFYCDERVVNKVEAILSTMEYFELLDGNVNDRVQRPWARGAKHGAAFAQLRFEQGSGLEASRAASKTGCCLYPTFVRVASIQHDNYLWAGSEHASAAKIGRGRHLFDGFLLAHVEW